MSGEQHWWAEQIDALLDRYDRTGVLNLARLAFLQEGLLHAACKDLDSTGRTDAS